MLLIAPLLIAVNSTFVAAPALADEQREKDVAAIRLAALKQALRMAGDGWKGTVVYTSVGQRVDPPERLLSALQDGTHQFKKESACPRRHWPGLADSCQPEPGAIVVRVGDIRFLGPDLAETNVGYGFGPTSGLMCPYRFKRAGEEWALVPPAEFVGLCKVL
jgi:hypothetical protein